MSVQRLTRAGLARIAPAHRCRSPAPKGSTAHAESIEVRLDGDRMSHYQKPPELYDGLRLHQNENTGGCSPRVLEALARAARRRSSGSTRRTPARPTRCAQYLGVEAERVTLVNGLDEGIMAVAVAYLRAEIGGPMLEAIVRSRRSRSSASTRRSPAASSCR